MTRIGWTFGASRLALAVGISLASLGSAFAQAPAPGVVPPGTAPLPTAIEAIANPTMATGSVTAPGIAPAPEIMSTLPPGVVTGPVAGEIVAPAVVALPPEVQVVRFHGPAGVSVEVLGPPPEPIPLPANNDGLATFGLRLGVGYQLRVTNLPERPGVELFPVVEVVGHLHRPPGIDPLRYPIRVMLGAEDLEDVAARGQLVTQVVYLEDPEQALPVGLPQDEIPVVTLNPAENPQAVAAALGRVMAVVRMGGRTPMAGEIPGSPIVGLYGGPCPFMGQTGGPCGLPCGPARGTPPPPGQPWMPRDEFLCDGGDHGLTAKVAGDGALRGIDPRDAVVRFRDDRQHRALPTNMVCVYAPRFAAVRTSIGPNEALAVSRPRGAERVETQEIAEGRHEMRTMAQTTAAEIGRHRSRASSQVGRVHVGAHSELRILAEADAVHILAGNTHVTGPESQELRQNPIILERDQPLAGIKTAEGLVMEGIVQGARAQVMSWRPDEVTAVEVPPNKPGMAVVKQVDAAEALPGDVLTYTITYRNMGNVPVTAVAITDSLLPRLEYVPGSAKGPAGTIFTAEPNVAGSDELRWEIGTVAPGAQGAVQFQARVR